MSGTNEPLLGGLAQSRADRAEPLLRAGNTNCGGCGMSIGLNLLSRAIGERPVQMVIPACCGIVTAGPFPYGAYGAPVVAATFASAAAVATGMAHVARLNGEGLVEGFEEKPQFDGWINGGFFVFEPEALDYIHEDSTLEREPLENLAHDGRLRAYRHTGFWDCMDTYKDAVLLNDLWEAGRAPWKESA